MTPATTQALPFESEGNPGDTDQNFRELLTIERFGRFGRREDSVGAAAKLGAIANPAGNDRARGRIDAWKKDGALRRKRAGQKKVRRNFVAKRRVENYRSCIAIEFAGEDLALDE